ncbi:type II toxin-antitoxin system RelE/ParE family toxin [Candidatus Magnetobacterium casense]|uniref:Type II toxin-antitoxin system RelE/ParE family toxin n=1 Tax=Candidatus Magnetobacterium casense TaxID=1455061 RepID=A0ABS6RX59_9BACT|nr:type II toxin-antitoxin system RelE/ParE family toxin [Candidatus Magnetobacterium casensis]
MAGAGATRCGKIVPHPLERERSGAAPFFLVLHTIETRYIRVGDFRVIYTIEANKISIISIGHRKDIYK